MEATWQTKETLAIILGRVLDAGDGAVVTVGETGLVMHRTVLVARNPVSAAVLQGANVEPSSGQVTVSAVEDPVLRQLLAFLCGLQARPPQLPGMASRLLPASADKCGVPALEARWEQQVPVGTAVALTVGHSCTGPGQAAVAYVEPLSVEVMATRGRASAAYTLAENVGEITGLLPGTGTPSPAVSGGSLDATTQPRRARRRPCRRRRRTLATPEPSSGQVTVSAVEDPVLRQLLAFLCGLQARPPQLPGTASRLLPASADKCGVPALEDRCEQQVPVGTAVALAVGHSCTGSGKAAVAYVEPPSVEVTATRGQAGAANTLAENVGKISGLLSGTGTLSPAVSGGTTQPRRARRRRRRTPATAAPATAASHHTPSPDDTAVSCLRSLSAVEKGRRLIEAAKEGALEELEALLVAGADAGFRDVDLFRRSALHWAAAEGHEEVARRLVWHGAAVDTRSGTQWTPLHLAAQGGHAAMVRLLLAAPADHSTRDCQGWTPLHVAAFSGHKEVVTALMEAGADKGNTDLWGNTPWDVATQRGHWKLVDLLAVPPSLHQYSL